MIVVPAAQVIEDATRRGIRPGVYVTWTNELRGVVYRRYGCIMAVRDNGFANVQASNARFDMPLEYLHVAPNCKDAVLADQAEIYGLVQRWA